jgi:hypothetical protein
MQLWPQLRLVLQGQASAAAMCSYQRVQHAILCCIALRQAVLCCAAPCCAAPCCAVLLCAVLCYCDLCGLPCELVAPHSLEGQA